MWQGALFSLCYKSHFMHQEKEKQHQELLNEWYAQRPSYDIDGEFVWDGPSNWELFYLEKPRILFLSKESFNGFHPNNKANAISGTKAINMSRWAWLVKEYFGMCFVNHAPPNNKELIELYHNDFSRIAEIEVKKRNNEYSKSTNADIESFAKKDAAFLAKQIELIDPHVIICGNTFSSYREIYVQDFADNIPILLAGESKQSWKHNNRLVVDFFHPSYSQLPGGNEAYRQLWIEVLDCGLVFQSFKW